MERIWVTVEGNEAVANIAHALSEVIAIYPINPSTSMGEMADAWSAAGRENLWGTVPHVMEMQSEGGAAGAIHGALQTGALATTFTASQGLLLMIPNMYKIAGELTPVVFHVAARSLATQALSIFGDHSDVMATRATGFALLASNSVQEAQDMALIAHASTLEARIPFVHFFDGFRTSAEIDKIEKVTDEDLRAMIDDAFVQAHRQRALSPEHPFIRGTAQNPDVYFQARETTNPYYADCPAIVQKAMDTFSIKVGRQYHLFDYVGAPDAERVIVVMGSGAETVQATAEYLLARGVKVGVVKVRLFRPFSMQDFLPALPPTVKVIATLDRTKEPGSIGEPLYLDVSTAVKENWATSNGNMKPRIIGGRYGLASKEFTPAMVKGIFDEMSAEDPKNHFTIGIQDDVTHDSLDYDVAFAIESEDTVQCVFWGLGSDGTVGANKNSIKIIWEETENYAQGYFVYDCKKSGSITISHLRFGPHPIHATYLIGNNQANFVACHQFTFLERIDVLKYIRQGGIFLLDSIYGPESVWDHLPIEVQQVILEKKLRFYVINAQKIASDIGMGGLINTVMQTCFFAISGILPKDEAIAQIKKSIKKSYGKRGEAVVQCKEIVGEELTNELLNADQSSETGIQAQRKRVAFLKEHLREANSINSRSHHLLSVADALVRKSVWIIGGDGWAYDIGFGGLDRVLASGRNVNILVLDTEVYSNTGGQASKSTSRGAVAKFAARGKSMPKKDLGLLAMAYGNVYVAHVAMGANDQQTLRAFLEAEAYDGPSLIIAYSHCIAHGIEMSKGLEQQKLAVQTGYWPLYRYNPELHIEGKNPMVLDSKEPNLPLEKFAYNETRFRMLLQSNEERAESLMKLAQQDVRERWNHYHELATVQEPKENGATPRS